MKAEHNLTLNIIHALNHEIRLTIIDILKKGPQPLESLCKICGYNQEELLEHINVLCNTGLILITLNEDISLSPFGMYGAREHMKQVLCTTNEDGCCDGCNGCK